MDLAKIGAFIKERRKEKKLTQAQLALKIGVSEKTVSKWECGNGFPDATLMLPLCKALGITANELLSGKNLVDGKEYKQEAESNLISLKKNQEKTAKFLLTLEWVIGVLSLIILAASVFIADIANIPEVWRCIIVFIGLVICLFGMSFCMAIEKDAGFYECGLCNHKYIPTSKQIFLSMHMGRTRYMKCPNCKKKSWQKKTINKD